MEINVKMKTNTSDTHLYSNQDLRKLFFCLLDPDMADGVDVNLVALLGIGIEAFDRSQRARQRRRRLAELLQMLHVAGNQGLGRIQQLNARRLHI